jgi:hypothetical protein
MQDRANRISRIQAMARVGIFFMGSPFAKSGWVSVAFYYTGKTDGGKGFEILKKYEDFGTCREIPRLRSG